MKLNNKLTTLLKNILVTVLSFTILFTIFGYESKDWNGIEEEKDKTLLQKLFNRFYFSMVSFSTIGLGDISPKTIILRSIMIIYMIFVTVPIYDFLK
tara:strand:+ start:1260 stop:1550 length:291 start_codon:yes stop_codon:yes gene_type:complete